MKDGDQVCVCVSVYACVCLCSYLCQLTALPQRSRGGLTQQLYTEVTHPLSPVTHIHTHTHAHTRACAYLTLPCPV